MPDLNFKVTGVEPAARGLIPLLHFHLEVTNSPETELIQSVILQAQIQIQSAHRSYDEEEREKLVDLFGTPDRWGQTLRNRLWAHANTTVRPFTQNVFEVPFSLSYEVDLFGRVRRNVEAAMHLLNRSIQEDAQAKFVNATGYAPVTLSALDRTDQSLLPWLATQKQNAQRGVLINASWWQDKLEALGDRWNNWRIS